MLSIGKLAHGQEAYYLETVAAGAEEYYVGHGEAPGAWVGRSAARLGLTGEVAGDDLAALLVHADPTTGAPLTGGRSAPKVAGFDLTFCAPKSVSLLWAFGSPDTAAAVVAAHVASVRSALAVMEVEAGRVRRGRGGAKVLAAEGLVAAGFRHRTSRAGDPHLHTHVVTANIGFCAEDGRWSALDARHLYRWAQPVGYLYEAQLRHELTARLGVAWGPVVNGIADLAGVPRSLIEEFSTRRREILEHLDAHGTGGGRAAQVATYATRRPKTPTGAAADLRAGWVDHAVDAGYDFAALEKAVREEAVLRGRRADSTVDRPRLFAELAGPEGVTERRSTFDRRDVVKAVCARLPAGAPVGDVIGLVDGFLACDQVLGVGGADPLTRWTTRDLLACERHLVDTAVATQRRRVCQIPSETVVAALDTRPSLSDEQRVMVAGLCRSGHGVDIVIGAAGSGKTSGLAVARHAWEASGHAVLGCALAARAAEQLADGAGIPSGTLDRLLGDLDAGRRRLGSRHVVIVDEAGMVGTRHLDRLLRHTSTAGAKLVLVGDPAQLPSIHAGGVLVGLARRLRPHHLTENHRQTEPWEQEALAGMRAGDTSDVASAYRDHDRVEDHTDIDTVIERWAAARDRGSDVLLLAGRRDQVSALNRAARARLQACGVVGPDQYFLGGRRYAIGDHVVTLRNDHHLGVLNGTRGVITNIDDQNLHLELRDGRHVQLPHVYVKAGWVNHGYALTIHKAQGVTADETITLADDTLAREHAYVALSRGRLNNRIIVAAADGFDEHDHGAAPPAPADRFTPILDRSAAQEMAIEL